MKKLLYIINPGSGTGGKKNLESLINKYSQKTSAAIKYTEYAGHAYEISKSENANYDGIIAVGGDGSVNEVSGGLINTNTVFGIIPCGSGNGFSNSLGIPLNKKKAVELIDNFKTTTVDAVKINDKTFVNVAGIGFDALIAHKFARYHKRGFLSYLKIILREYRKYQNVSYNLSFDDKKNIKMTSFLLTIANGKQWGNNSYIAPGAELNDGLLNIVNMKKFPFRASVSIGLRLFRKTIEKSKYIETYTSSKLSINKPGEIIAHIDGEPVFFQDKINIEIIPEALNVIAP